MEVLSQIDNTHLFVSNLGRVYNSKKKKWLSQSFSGRYCRVHPRLRNSHNHAVHRLVAEFFVPNPDNKPFVLHLDNNTKNNRWDNLKWGTQSENVQQAYAQNRISAKGEKNGKSKLTEVDVMIIREARKAGFIVREIADYFKMNRSYMNGICSSRCWSHHI